MPNLRSQCQTAYAAVAIDFCFELLLPGAGSEHCVQQWLQILPTGAGLWGEQAAKRPMKQD